MIGSMRTLAEYVTQRREELGLNQKQLADRAGIPPNMVNRIEKGVTKLPSPEFRSKLAMGLGVTHLDILVAAGELEPGEVKSAGAALSDERAYPARIEDALSDIDWSDPKTVDGVAFFLRTVAGDRGRTALKTRKP